MPKSKLVLLVPALLILSLVGFVAYRLISSSSTEEVTPPPAKRQIINALPIPDRPFITLFPHQTNKLITLYMDKPGNTPELTVDIEYLSGNSLKGGRTSISLPVELPFTQAFLLGSCSSGGKCSFDQDISTGTIKTKLENDTEINILKSNYVFIDGPSATTDQKLKFTPIKYTETAILSYTHGYIGTYSGEVVSEPFVITSASSDDVTGTLTLISDATSLAYFDGQDYQVLEEVEAVDGQLTVDLDIKPWSRQVTIIRDDLKGETQDVTLYLVGPFLPLK